MEHSHVVLNVCIAAGKLIVTTNPPIEQFDKIMHDLGFVAPKIIYLNIAGIHQTTFP